jgi:hypothetical protein
MQFSHTQQTENGLTEKGVCLLQTENGNSKLSSLFAANGSRKQKFVFLGRQTINGY